MKQFSRLLFLGSLFLLQPMVSYAAQASEAASPTLWQLVASGGICVAFLGLLSVVALAVVIHLFRTLTPQKLTPLDFTDNILFLLEKKEYEKAITVCKQQENMISAVALRGLQKLPKGRLVAEEAMQVEGKARIDKLWQNLSYLADIAVVAPMIGLLGTVFGMIDAFNFFKAGSVHPGVLTQGLAKAMVNTALGLIIAVPCLIFYSYFRGRAAQITSNAERAASEIAHAFPK